MMIRNTYPILLFICSLIQSCGKETQDDTIIDIDTDTTLVDVHGLLVVDGNKIVDKNNEPISLAGNSFFWSNDGWGGEKYYRSEVVEWLKKDWNTTIVRAAMGVEDPGGYLENKTANKDRVKIIVDAAIEQGLYVIIDWHSHHCLLYTSPSPRDVEESRMPSSA